MANRPKKIIRRKPKKVRSSKLQQKLVNGKYLGHEEPKLPTNPTDTQKATFYSWCSYMVAKSEARAWLEDYLNETGREPITGIPDRWVYPSLCYQARLRSKGVEFSEYSTKNFMESLTQLYTHRGEAPDEPEAEDGEESDEPKAVVTERPTIQERIAEKATNVIGDLEGMIDDGDPIDLDKFYRERGVNPKIARQIVAKIRPRTEELREALQWKDQDLKEAYRHMGRAGIRTHLETLDGILETTERFISNTVKARAPRKKKAPSAEKKLQFLVQSYQKDSKEYHLSSIDPSKILGAQELWTFNTKYKLITVFRAESMGGQLDVSRCKITGFDKNNSYTYRCGRKPESVVDAVLKGTKASNKKAVAGLKTCALAERVNENTILLRV